MDATTKKADTSIGFLRRNLASLPTQIKSQCYKTLVRPILEYASPVCDPYTASKINKLESVQRRAARFVVGDYRTTSSTSQMIHDLEWPSLQQRREDSKVVLVYMIVHALVDIQSTSYLHPQCIATRGHTLRRAFPFCRTGIYRYSFFPSGIRLWNQLPAHLATIISLDTLKAGLALELLSLFYPVFS